MSTIVTTGEAGETKPPGGGGAAGGTQQGGAVIPNPEGVMVMAFLACFVSVAFVGLVYLLLFFPPDETKAVTLLTAMTGILGGSFTTIVGWFFGNARNQAITTPNGGH